MATLRLGYLRFRLLVRLHIGCNSEGITPDGHREILSHLAISWRDKPYRAHVMSLSAFTYFRHWTSGQILPRWNLITIVDFAVIMYRLCLD
ncbi:hypothetical protein RSAG8_02491, partial [Rhizoctonia solani AG-8 WAC10335]